MASNIFDLSDRVALIAGASRGIGRAIAQGLAEAGASIALCSRTEVDLLKAAEQIRSLGYRVEVFPADLSNVRQIEALVRDVLNRMSQIDILVNVAGVNCRKLSTEITEQDCSVRSGVGPCYVSEAATFSFQKNVFSSLSGSLLVPKSPL